MGPCTYMTGETMPRVMCDYVADFDREVARDPRAPHQSFFDKWGLLIRLTTGVHLLEIQGMEAFAAACVAARRCRELTSETSASSQSALLPERRRSVQ